MKRLVQVLPAVIFVSILKSLAWAGTSDAVPITPSTPGPSSKSPGTASAVPTSTAQPDSGASGELFHFRRSQGTAPAEIFLRGGKGSYLWAKSRQTAEQVKYLEDALKSTQKISLQLDPATKEVISIPSFAKGGAK